MGMIKDLLVRLSQIPMNIIIMDVMVAVVPTKYGMLLSRRWSKQLKGTMHVDLKYDIVHMFAGETRRLYKEAKFSYVVSDNNIPNKYHIYTLPMRTLNVAFCQ